MATVLVAEFGQGEFRIDDFEIAEAIPINRGRLSLNFAIFTRSKQTRRLCLSSPFSMPLH